MSIINRSMGTIASIPVIDKNLVNILAIIRDTLGGILV